MLNLHLSATPVVNASRVLKQTSALEDAQIFDRIVIVGHTQPGTPSVEALSLVRTIIRVPSITEDKRGKSIHVKIAWFGVWMFKVFVLYRRSNVACVNAHSISVLPLAWALSVRTKSRLIYDPHELETRTSTMKGMQGWLCSKLERIFIGRCDAVFAVSEGISDWYQKAYSIPRPVVVRNLPDVQAGSTNVVDLKAVLGIDSDALLFVHVGALTKNRNILNVLDAFEHPENPHHVVFFGRGPLERQVQDRCSASSNVHLHEPVPSSDVVPWIRGADFGLCLTEVTCESNKFALPNKVFECVTAGLPLVATYLEEVHKIFGNDYLQMVVANVPQELTRHILELDNSRAHELSKTVATWSVPMWQTESVRMIDRYSEIEFSKGRS